MILVQEWQQMLYLACPMMKDLTSLIWSGLFVNELSMHDYSRDIMLATTQEQIELKMALNAAEKKGQVRIMVHYHHFNVENKRTILSVSHLDSERTTQEAGRRSRPN